MYNISTKWQRLFYAYGAVDLTSVQDIFIEKCSLNRVKMYARRKETPSIQQLTYRGNKQALRIYEYMYKDATIWMPRKRDKIKSILGVTD